MAAVMHTGMQTVHRHGQEAGWRANCELRQATKVARVLQQAAASGPPPSTRPKPGCFAGVLTQQSLAEFQRTINEIPAAHFVFAKAALPALKEGSSSSLVFISEGAGEHPGELPASLGCVKGLRAKGTTATAVFRPRSMAHGLQMPAAA